MIKRSWGVDDWISLNASLFQHSASEHQVIPGLYGANPVDPSIPGVLGCPKPTKCPPAMSRSTKQHHWIPSVSSSPRFTRWYLIRYWPRVGDRLAWPVLSWPLRLSIWTFEGVSIGGRGIRPTTILGVHWVVAMASWFIGPRTFGHDGLPHALPHLPTRFGGLFLLAANGGDSLLTGVCFSQRLLGIFIRNTLVLQAFWLHIRALLQVEFLSKCSSGCCVWAKVGGATSCGCKEKVDIYAFALIMPRPQEILVRCRVLWDVAVQHILLLRLFSPVSTRYQKQVVAHRASNVHCLVELLPSSNR